MSTKSSSSSSTTTETTSKPVTLQDVEGLTIAGNDLGSSQINITDGGAIQGSLELSGNVISRAAELTLGILDRQLAYSKDSLEALRATQAEANAFAIEGGRGEQSIMQDLSRGLLIVAGIVAAGFALRQLKGA